MGWNTAFGRMKQERNNLGFFKVFLESSDLSSESMRSFPYSFMREISEKDFSYKMVIKAQWGKSWDVKVSKNMRYYYMEKRGWDQFVSDNLLGSNEFITLIHKGNMVFDVYIYQGNGLEILTPRKLLPIGSSGGIKREEGEFGFKEVKKEEDNDMERGGALRAVKLKVRKKKSHASKTSKKEKIKRTKVVNGVPEFKIIIKKSYLKFLAFPKKFVDKYLPNSSVIFTVRHPNGFRSWKVLCLVRDYRTILSSGYSKLAREFPILVGDECTFKLIKPFEFLLVISK